MLADFDLILVIFWYHSVVSSNREIYFNYYNFLSENILRFDFQEHTILKYINLHLEEVCFQKKF